MKKYVINNGNIFKGTLKEFQKRWLNNANEQKIRDWCKENGYSLEVKNVPKCEFCKEPIMNESELTTNRLTRKHSHRRCFFNKYPDSKPKS